MGALSQRDWSEILASLRNQHPQLMRPWFDHLEPAEFRHGVIQVRTGDPNQLDYLSRQCQGAFTQAAQSVTGRLVTVNFLPSAQPMVEEVPLSFETETGQLALNDDYTFDNFVTGPSNRLAHAASVAVAENPGTVYNPLFVHGSVGLGKTHLLQAICHSIKENNESKILYISCETFTNHFVEAIERGSMHQFRDRYRHVDVLVIDDIQFLAVRERSREEFFHTFNSLYQSQKQIILSADESPNGIPSLEERLVSRFNWGLVARIDSPSLETRMAIVRKKARLNCIDINEEIVHYIAANVESNTRELEGAMTKVIALSQQNGGVIDLDLAREALGDQNVNQRKNITIHDIFRLAAQQYNVKPSDLQGKRRNRSIAYPRQICMYLARELTPLSLEEIGGYFGGRDHTTVMHAIRTIKDYRQQNADLDQELREIVSRLRK
jgi:chromosomal replication initiator protein